MVIPPHHPLTPVASPCTETRNQMSKSETSTKHEYLKHFELRCSKLAPPLRVFRISHFEFRIYLRFTSQPLSAKIACKSAALDSALRFTLSTNCGFQYIPRPAMPQLFV